MSRQARSASRSEVAPPAVVVGLDCITGLQTARILATRGVPVVGLTSRRSHWAAHTRACQEVVESPLSGDALLRALHDIASRWPGPFAVFPCTDQAVRALSSRRSELPAAAALPMSPHPVMEMLSDKLTFAEHAEAAGLPAPRVVVLRSRADAERAGDLFGFPCVLKPATKVASWLEHTTRKAFLVADREELLSVYGTVSGWADQLLLQEWVSGPETQLYSCNGYFDRGEPLALFVARKLRQWPPGVGTSASGEECRNDTVLATTERLFGDVEFTGLAYLEMKRDSRSGKLMIIEPNVGRPTGRSAIAEAGGVELVLTAYRHALGMALPEARTQHYGDARWLDLRRDAQAATVAMRRGELSLIAWARWLRGPKAHAIWSSHDPLPFAVDVAQATRTGVRQLARRVAPVGG